MVKRTLQYINNGKTTDNYWIGAGAISKFVFYDEKELSEI